MTITDLIPGVAQAKTIAIGVISLLLLSAIAYGAYRLHEYDTALTKSEAQVAVLTSKTQTLETDLSTCVSTNKDNSLQLDALRSDNLVATTQLHALATQKQQLLVTTQVLSKQIALAKGTALDGAVSDVLRNTLKALDLE